ncbi:MAG: hypothetical protein AB7U83_04960 [Vicinamibacterales bacterium]
MSRAWSAVRRHGDEQAGSPTVSRLIALVFVTAVVVGAVAGAIWMAWTLIRRTTGG